MKTIIKKNFYVTIAVGFIFGFSSCEKQKWEETKKLHEHGEGHYEHEHEHEH